MNKLEYTDAGNIEITGTLKEKISLKPITRILIRAVTGVAMCFFGTKLTIYMGIFFMLVAVFGFFVIKDKPVMDLYDDSVVVYDEIDSTKACKIMYEDLKMWSVDSSNSKVYFVLQDDSVVGVNNSRYLKAYNTLIKLVPEKCEPSQMDKLREKLKKGKE